MIVAFYAPLKAPDHPVPSGDREIARALLQALRDRGYQVAVASRFRSWDGIGDASRQARIRAVGRRLARRLTRRWLLLDPAHRPALWLTYHLYHKAPDWLGPRVAAALDIPYLVVEASVAAKQRHGPWSIGYAGVLGAMARAKAVLCLNPDDWNGLQAVVPKARLQRFAPFVDVRRIRPHQRACPRRRELTQRLTLDPSRALMAVVGMMRPGDKLASYRQLATALMRLRHLSWTLLVIGDGPARNQVRQCLAKLGPGRVRYLGQLSRDQVAALVAAADLVVWPAVNEAFGMALLEAQAAGVAVVAGDARGVSQVVAPGGGLLVPAGRPAALAQRIARLLQSPASCSRLGAAARRWTLRERDLAAAGARLDAIVRQLAKAPEP